MRAFQAAFSWVVIAHSLAFIGFWLTNSLFAVDTNNFLARKLGAPGDYLRAFLITAGVIALWSGARLLFAARAVMSVPLHRWTYLAAGLLFVALFYGSFIILFQESPVQKTRLVQFLQYHRLILDAVLLFALAAGVGAWLRSGEWSWGRAALPLVVLAALWALALAFPPGSVYAGALPPRPRLIAHRGTAFLLPENTLLSTGRAVQLGAYGIETDVRVSLDGWLFLMHDDTLARTTDAARIFPGRQKQPAEAFTRAELERLNAGMWFTQTDPYRSVANGLARGEDLERAESQGIPSFSDWLAVGARGGQVMIFDSIAPPEGHPFHEQFFDRVFAETKAAGVDGQIWYLAGGAEAARARAEAPEMILTASVDADHPPAASELVAEGFKVANSEYTLPVETIRQYQQAGLWVNLWTVDEPWQFSRLWILGVNSTTTNNLPVMQALEAPILALSLPLYRLAWSAAGLLAAALALAIGKFL